MKQYYFLQHFDELRESAQKLFEEARKTGCRKQQTQIVNGVMKKCSSGNRLVCAIVRGLEDQV